jgi:hypothetical protein
MAEPRYAQPVERDVRTSGVRVKLINLSGFMRKPPSPDRVVEMPNKIQTTQNCEGSLALHQTPTDLTTNNLLYCEYEQQETKNAPTSVSRFLCN